MVVPRAPKITEDSPANTGLRARATVAERSQACDRCDRWRQVRTDNRRGHVPRPWQHRPGGRRPAAQTSNRWDEPSPSSAVPTAVPRWPSWARGHGGGAARVARPKIRCGIAQEGCSWSWPAYRHPCSPLAVARRAQQGRRALGGRGAPCAGAAQGAGVAAASWRALAGRREIDSVAIAPMGRVAIETKPRSYDGRQLGWVLEQAGWLDRRRWRWCRRWALPVLCVVRASGVEWSATSTGAGGLDRPARRCAAGSRWRGGARSVDATTRRDHAVARGR
jgi:hypothetical protein